jgi:hypothetical protein
MPNAAQITAYLCQWGEMLWSVQRATYPRSCRMRCEGLRFLSIMGPKVIGAGAVVFLRVQVGPPYSRGRNFVKRDWGKTVLRGRFLAINPTRSNNLRRHKWSRHFINFVVVIMFREWLQKESLKRKSHKSYNKYSIFWIFLFHEVFSK